MSLDIDKYFLNERKEKINDDRLLRREKIIYCAIDKYFINEKRRKNKQW